MNIDFHEPVIRLFSTLSMILFFVLSYFVVINDIKTQKIPNKILLRFFKIGVALYIALFSIGLLSGNSFALTYVKIVAINIPVAIVIGYVFWYYDLWSPGDGKYFPLVVMFFPIKFYQYQFINYFPPLVVLINAYVLGFILIVLYVIIIMMNRVVELYFKGFYTKEYFEVLKENIIIKATDPKFVFNKVGTILYMASILIVMRTVFDTIFDNISFNSANFNLALMVGMYFAGSKIMDTLIRNKMAYRMSYFVFVSVVIFQYNILGLNVFLKLYDMLTASFFVIVVIPVARKMIEEYQRVTEVLLVENIKMGVELTEEAVLTFMEQKNIELPAYIPLTDEQAQQIKDNFPNMMEVRRVTHITFGPFLFLGAVFVMIFQKTIMHYL